MLLYILLSVTVKTSLPPLFRQLSAWLVKGGKLVCHNFHSKITYNINDYLTDEPIHQFVFILQLPNK